MGSRKSIQKGGEQVGQIIVDGKVIRFAPEGGEATTPEEIAPNRQREKQMSNATTYKVESTISDSGLSEAYEKLKDLHRKIRKLGNNWPSPIGKIASYGTYREWMNGLTARRSVIVSPVIHGCEYRQKSGGCFPCGEAYGIGKTPDLALSVKPIVEIVLEWLSNPEEFPQWVCWYLEGSNLNPKECPREALQMILTLIASVPSVKRITIESRPEFVTDDALKLLEETSTKCRGIEIEIGIGVEVYSDIIRRYCFNKGETFTWGLFEQVVRKIKEREGLKVLAYVILKPLFLDEREGIEEAIKTIRKCFEIGVDAVSLEITSIHEFTLLEYLWLKGLYRPPWLWSAIEVAQNVYRYGEIRIGGEPPTYFPASKRVAYNDEACTAKVWRAIRSYNETHDINIFKPLTCQCKEEWYHVVNSDNSSAPIEEKVKKRIISAANHLSLEDYILRKLYLSIKEGD